jgi:hypothetical protein
MHAFTFFGPNPAIAHVVEAIWDIDLPDAGQAPAFTFKVPVLGFATEVIE